MPIMMRLLAVCLSLASLLARAGRVRAPSAISPRPRSSEGLALLFDGKTSTNWHAIPLGDHPAA